MEDGRKVERTCKFVGMSRRVKDPVELVTIWLVVNYS
jgi:hypothetical protein